MNLQATATRRAVVAAGGTAQLRSSLPVPRPSCDEVLIDVHAVGLCRTDLYAIAGQIPAASPLIPGHEFSGVVAEVGTDEIEIQVGQRVAVNPVIPCGACGPCHSGDAAHCACPQFLGVDRDGACADCVAVPASTIIPIPEGLPFPVVAFTEPVAASLAVLKAEIRPEQRGLVYGENRIARLTQRVFEAFGFDAVSVGSGDQAKRLPDSHFDFVVETLATTETLAEMVRLVRPRGRIILKSRQYQPIQMVLREILLKEPVFEAVNYGRFDEAVDCLATGRIRVDDLIGNCYPLEEFQAAFAHAQADDQRKTFLIPREA